MRGESFAGRPSIWVSLILDWLAAGSSIDEILASYPGLTEEDVRACIAYGAEMSRQRYLPGFRPSRFLRTCPPFVPRLSKRWRTTKSPGRLWVVEIGRIREYEPDEDDDEE